MRISSIDIGTNTVLLLVADIAPDGTIAPLAHGHEIVRLGKGVEHSKRILPESIDRLRRALRQYVEISRKYRVDKLVACATSAVREAENRDEFCEVVQKEFGIDVVVLSGEEEAQLTYLGTLSEFTGTEVRSAVIDIGGGSTEITTGTGRNIRSSVSLPLGCVRLTERFLSDAPPTTMALESAREAVVQKLGELKGLSGDSRLVGVAGTVTTLAAMDLRLPEYDPLRVSGHRISLDTMDRMCTLLSGKTVEEIRHIPQVHPDRADILLAGVIILQEVMKRFGWMEITASDRGLRYGFALREAGREIRNSNI